MSSSRASAATATPMRSSRVGEAAQLSAMSRSLDASFAARVCLDYKLSALDCAPDVELYSSVLVASRPHLACEAAVTTRRGTGCFLRQTFHSHPQHQLVHYFFTIASRFFVPGVVDSSVLRL